MRNRGHAAASSIASLWTLHSLVLQLLSHVVDLACSLACAQVAGAPRSGKGEEEPWWVCDNSANEPWLNLLVPGSAHQVSGGGQEAY